MIPLAIVVCYLAGAGAVTVADAAALADPSFPTVQVVPLPHHEIAFEIGGIEVARYYAGDNTPKPFIFPLIGPAGKRLTTMAHPIDPHGHRHHRSVWIGHRDVNGHNFWEETDGNRIVMTRLDAYGQTGNTAWFRAAHEWRDADGAPIVNEERTWTMVNLEGGRLVSRPRDEVFACWRTGHFRPDPLRVARCPGRADDVRVGRRTRGELRRVPE